VIGRPGFGARTGEDRHHRHHPRSTPENAGVQPSASSASMPKSNSANGYAAEPLRTVANDGDGSGGGPSHRPASYPGWKSLPDRTRLPSPRRRVAADDASEAGKGMAESKPYARHVRAPLTFRAPGGADRAEADGGS
jgi:hypothetical protein